MTDNNKRNFSLFGNHFTPTKVDNNYALSSSTLNSVSPYLNFDPTILQSGSSSYIIPEGQKERRGRFEMMFMTIGSAVIAGNAIGTVTGLYRGISNTNELKGNIRRSAVINYMARQGGKSASAFGLIAFFYSCTGTLLHHARDTDDNLNTIAAGTLTGLIYRSGSLVGSLRGGLTGFILASLYTLITSKNSAYPNF